MIFDGQPFYNSPDPSRTADRKDLTDGLGGIIEII